MLENMREVHKVNCFRMELTFSDIQSTFLGGGIMSYTEIGLLIK